jgi:hypothetical protein
MTATMNAADAAKIANARDHAEKCEKYAHHAAELVNAPEMDIDSVEELDSAARICERASRMATRYTEKMRALFNSAALAGDDDTAAAAECAADESDAAAYACDSAADDARRAAADMRAAELMAIESAAMLDAIPDDSQRYTADEVDSAPAMDAAAGIDDLPAADAAWRAHMLGDSAPADDAAAIGDDAAAAARENAEMMRPSGYNPAAKWDAMAADAIAAHADLHAAIESARDSARAIYGRMPHVSADAEAIADAAMRAADAAELIDITNPDMVLDYPAGYGAAFGIMAAWPMEFAAAAAMANACRDAAAACRIALDAMDAAADARYTAAESEYLDPRWPGDGCAADDDSAPADNAANWNLACPVCGHVFSNAYTACPRCAAADSAPAVSPIASIIGMDGMEWHWDRLADGFSAGLTDGFGESDAASIMRYAESAADMAAYADRLCELTLDLGMNAAMDAAAGMPVADESRRYASYAAHAAAIAPVLDAVMTDISHAIGLIAMDGIRLSDDMEMPAMRAALRAMAAGYECACAAERLRDECRESFDYYINHANVSHWSANRAMDARAIGAIAGCDAARIAEYRYPNGAVWPGMDAIAMPRRDRSYDAYAGQFRDADFIYGCAATPAFIAVWRAPYAAAAIAIR